MMRYRRRTISLLVFLLLTPPVLSLAAAPPECRSMETVDIEYEGPERFEEGILWEIKRPETETSYLLGTIHVSDETILTLPPEISEKLKLSRHFAMEALPNAVQAMTLSRQMFFEDSRRLDEMVSEAMYRRVVTILQAYHLSEEEIRRMKPWAAFITMSYPPNLRQILDLELLRMAVENGAEIHGLESLSEQGELFRHLELEDQIQLLADTVCHYETVKKDFEIMKSLYLKRDLKDMYIHGQSRSFEDNSVYESLTKRLLRDRNYLMVRRMQPLLKKGNAFIAIGAMHLAGEEGILALLANRGYQLSRIY